ncbi:isoleucine--tRNA ligase [Rummeliibacillus pycnus]|uniref:isoleucine--tRNA ligase n=1 Tax=Rummeliibacillus pycnus TaxID=101070 RepID=UPI0037CB25C8
MKESAFERETRVRERWHDAHTFEKSVFNRKGKKPFVFYEGPPTANGMPHVGHAFGRTVKDIVSRYKTMQGYYVERKAGWDTHGLPVELGVEKELGISGKQEIEEYGVEKFVKKCKESVFRYEKKWRSFTKQLGYWIDMENPYVTLENDYIESVWAILSHVHKSGELYKGHRVSPYCPSCQTSLSSHEVAQGYKDVKDLSVTAMFKLVGKENEYFLGWTTTPWTLPANVALAVHPDLTYVRVQQDDKIYIVVKSLVSKLFGEDMTVLDEKYGKDYEGTKYVAPLDFVKVEKGHEVVLADYVTESSGTGVVHIAPAYGEDDYKVVQKNKLSFVNVVDGQGRYTKAVPPLEGRFVKDCDVDIIKMLAEQGVLFDKEKYEHSYPHCWRCDSPLLYYATDSWFIKMSDHRDELLNLNAEVDWYPHHIKDGRFGNFLENVIDWNISRNRYWGTPLNVWQCDCCGHEVAPGSMEELKQLSKNPIVDIELHKPYIDGVVGCCPNCSGDMHRTPEVIDVWFDSGSMPFAQQHYPFNQDIKFAEQFPADVVIEGIDQTRGFFYSLLAVSTLYKGQAPYKSVLSLGHVLDGEGRKMSKSKGNALDPVEMIEQYGADALRWSFMTDSAPWNPKRFSHKTVQEAKSKFVDTLDNVFHFYQLYANIDGFQYDVRKKGVRTKLDEWILSRMNHTVQVVEKAMEKYDFTQASREIGELLEQISNWYIRRSRARFWANGLSDDKIAAYSTLFEVLTTVSKLAAPFTPYITDEIYTKLTGESVHLADYPKVHEEEIQLQLEDEMAAVLKIVELGRRIRNTEGIKVKQPLATMNVVTPNSGLESYSTIIQDELNIKQIQWVNSLDEFLTVEYKLNFKTAGMAFGKNVNKIKELVTHLEEDQKTTFKQEGKLEFTLDGALLTLLSEHILKDVHVPEGFALAEEAQFEVLVDIRLTEDLKQEGQIRELIRQVQEKRKHLNLPVEQYIDLAFKGNTVVIERFTELLKSSLLVNNLYYNESIEVKETFDVKIDGEKVQVGLVI